VQPKALSPSGFGFFIDIAGELNVQEPARLAAYSRADVFCNPEHSIFCALELKRDL
jgi:hypothetical protein